ncbi:alpha/beta hydrolase [Nakamurella sp. GG22]
MPSILHHRPRRASVPAGLTGAVLAVLLVGCSSSVSGTAVTAGPAGPTTGGPAASGSAQGPSAADTPAAVPAGLERYYGQQLDWGSCAELATSEETKFYRAASLQCADLTVPLVYDEPDGETISVKVLRKPATDQAQRIGSVITNPGGPGGSGVEFAGQLAGSKPAAQLNKRFDFVGFDPRGVAYSTPEIRCQTDEQRDAARAKTPRTRTQAEVDAADANAKKLAEGCVALSGTEHGIDGAKLLANIGTRDVVKDLDVLRAAVGDEKLTYIGWSYGTSIGTAYAEQFPENVRAMILDGAIDPKADPGARDIGQAEGFQKAFEDFAAWCADQESCALGTNPEGATEAYQELVRPLLDEPRQLADGRVLSFGDANTGSLQALYSQSLWETLSTALQDLSNGDGALLMALADFYNGRAADGSYTNLQDAFGAIQCIDGSRLLDPAQAQVIAEKYAAAAPFFGSGDPPRAIKDPCAFWPVPPTSEPHLPDIKGLPKVLVISTTKDPATPYQEGVNLAKALDASLLTVEGTNHTAYLGIDSSCVDDIGTAYLTTLELPADGATCS